MPRIRSLKYEYFINEDLAQISAEARLLGLGLTTLADREGRLEDRPLRIKVLLFPYHDVDVDSAINELQNAGFLRRYVVEGKRYIVVTNFLKHQKPHPRETPSVIPSHEKVSPRRAKASPTKQKPTEQVESSRRNGLGDLCLGDLGSSVKGNGDLGNGGVDSADAGASATGQSQQDFDIWKLGVGKLVATGTSEPDARSLLGKMRRDYGEDVLSSAITKLLAQNPVDPKAYLVGILQGRSPTQRATSKVDGSLAAAERVAAKYEQRG